MTAMPMTLGDLCELKYGKSLPATQRQHGPATVYGSNGPVGTHSEALLSGPAIVVGRKGSYGEVHYSDGDLWPIDTTYFVDRSATKCDLRWLYHLLKYLPLTTLNKAAAIPGLSREDAYRLPVTKPPLDEQRRIAAILDKAGALRRKRKRALELLDGLTQSTFLEIFGDPIENPRGYPTRRLIDLADPARGISYGIVQRGDDQDSGVNVLRISDFQSGEINFENLKKTTSEISDRYRRTILKGGEIVISIRGTVGRCADVPKHLSGSNVSREVAVIPTLTAEKNFFYLPLIRSDAAQRRIIQDVKGVAQSGINLEDLRELPIIQPPSDDFERFRRASDQLQKLHRNLRAQSDINSELFSSLQHRAFTGQL